jgi:hypothetical protein
LRLRNYLSKILGLLPFLCPLYSALVRRNCSRCRQSPRPAGARSERRASGLTRPDRDDARQEEESTATKAGEKEAASPRYSPSRTRNRADRRNQEQQHGGGSKKPPTEARAAHVLTGETSGDSICCPALLCRSCRDCWNAGGERERERLDQRGCPGAASDQKKASFWFRLDVKAETRHTAVNCCNLELS